MIHVELKKEVTEFLAQTQSVYFDRNDNKTFLILGAYAPIEGRENCFTVLDLKEQEIFVKEQICKMIGIDIKSVLENSFNAGRERLTHPDWDNVYEEFEDYYKTVKL